MGLFSVLNFASLLAKTLAVVLLVEHFHSLTLANSSDERLS